MQNLEALRLSSIEQEHIEEVISVRQHVIEKALADHDLKTLSLLSRLDKDNMQWLQKQKQSLQLEIQNLSKVQQYIE